MERVLEMLYWSKAKQTTTPESLELSTTLDKIFKHKTLRINDLIHPHGSPERQ